MTADKSVPPEQVTPASGLPSRASMICVGDGRLMAAAGQIVVATDTPSRQSVRVLTAIDAAELTSSERVWAAVSHLGVPFWGPILPTVAWAVAPTGSFRREHARHACSYRLIYLPFHLFFTVLMVWGPVGPLLVRC
jgi:hypothetical protein